MATIRLSRDDMLHFNLARVPRDYTTFLVLIDPESPDSLTLLVDRCVSKPARLPSDIVVCFHCATHGPRL